MERMKKPKFIKEIEKSEGKERAKCGRWYIRVYGELDHKPMVELESLEMVVKELHKVEEENRDLVEKIEKLLWEKIKLEEENKKLKEELGEYKKMFEDHLKECYIKNTAEFLDKKFPAINGFMEEDTLQELRGLGEI